MPTQTTATVKPWARLFMKRFGGGPAAAPPQAATPAPQAGVIETQAATVLPLTIPVPPPMPPVVQAAPLTPDEQMKKDTAELRDKVGVLQINILNKLDFDAALKAAETKLAKIGEKKRPDPKLPELKAKVDAFKALTFENPKDRTSLDHDRADAVDRLEKLNGELDAFDPKAGDWHAVHRSKRSDDKQANERLAKLTIKLAPQRGKLEPAEDYQARVDAAENKYAEDAGVADPADRLARLKKLDALFMSGEDAVSEHTAKLLDRAISVGMGDCEPLLIDYATELAKRDAQNKPAGDKDELKRMAEKLCKSIVQKDLFGRYVGDQLAGAEAVEMIQNQDADKYYFWSMTDSDVDKKIVAKNPTQKELATRLEKTAAAAMFNDLNFGNPWSSDQFRAIFVAISDDYAKKVIERARDAKAKGGRRTICITAFRGPNEDSVLGKTEWPRLKVDIEKEGLPFTFEIYGWSGAPSESTWSAASSGFADPGFKQASFKSRALITTLTTVADVEKTKWNFKDNDDVQRCGGLYKGSKNPGGAFAAMSVAYFGGQLVGKRTPDGLIWKINPDGSTGKCTNQDEASWVAAQSKAGTAATP